MKKLLAVAFIVAIVPLSGCTMTNGVEKIKGYQDLMAEIPDHEFSRFEYHRNGVYSNANITATGALKKDGKLKVQSININANYGPESFSITLEGYGRDIEISDDKGE